MKKRLLAWLLAALTVCAPLAGCAGPETPADSSAPASADQGAGTDRIEPAENAADEGMTPVYGESLRDGVYAVKVDSSSSMFRVVSCELTVAGGEMTAVMTMGGTGYLKVFMGTGEEAAAAAEEDCIPFAENALGEHTFTVPVEALNMGVKCAAYSKNKELWYDRTLVFRADSLPVDALAEGVIPTAADLDLADGAYTVDVALEGGSGRAGVASPAKITVADGAVTAAVVMSSSNYDLMVVDGVEYRPVTLEGGSTFEIPVAGFDWAIPIEAETTAMGSPHMVSYTLTFDSASIAPAQ